MKYLKRIITATCAAVVAVALAIPSLPVSAQTSASLSIVPKKNYVIEPGKTVNDKLTIRNIDGSSDLQLTLRVVDFTFTDDGGTPKLFLDPNAPRTTWSLKPFMKVPEKVTVPKGSSKTLDMSVAIPAKHGAGSYYSAIVYSTGAPDGGNVGLSASGVTLVFTQVPGQVNEDLKLEKFGAYKKQTPSGPAGYTYFSTEEPQNIAYTLKNDGNVTEAPVGSITVKNMFGQETVIDNVNPNGSLALIGQSRTYLACIKLSDEKINFQGTQTDASTCVSPGLLPGYYTAKLDLFYGQNGNRTQEITANASFWYMPWWFIALCLIILAALAYLIWRLVRFVRFKLYGNGAKKSSRRKK